MKYQDWYDKFVVDKYGKNKTEVFEEMIKNKASDRKQFKKFKEVLGKEVPNTLKEFQELKYNNSGEFRKLKELYEGTTVKQLLKEHNINIIDRADANNYIVNNYYPKITKLRGHALENLQQKSDRYNMTKEKAQEFVNNAKVVLYDKDRETIKFISEVGYAVLNFDNELVTAVPQKWRKKYEKFIREE